jgi:hypothetical protein
MRNFIFFISSLLICSTCSSSKQDLEIGASLPSDAKNTGSRILVAPAQFLQAFDVTRDDYVFTVCPDQNNRIVYISPTQDNFTTPEGVKIGSKYISILNEVQDSAQVFPGWAYVLKLPSGWNVAFVEGENMTDNPLRDDSEVSFIFKSKYIN